MMKQNGFGWKKDLGMARLLRKHYNVNYKVNLRMFLKVGGGEPHLCTGFQSMGQTEEIFRLPKHQALQLNV